MQSQLNVPPKYRGTQLTEAIPFSPPYIDQNAILEVLDTLKSGWITSGPKVKLLEAECMRLSECAACVCVNSWTSGALLALKWWGVGPGDEVIIPAYTYAATALAVMHAGATPVMVDVLNDCTMDPEKLRQAITPRTKAVIPVDMGGWPCAYQKIHEVLNAAEVRQLFRPATDVQQKLGRVLVISDAAHSMGARMHGNAAAVYSDLTIYSLHAVKNITTAEGGVICINLPAPFDNQSVYAWMKLNSLNGQTKDAFTKNKAGEWRYDIVSDGLKINMPDLCAALGLSQIRQYESHLLPQRRRVFEWYNNGFESYAWAQPCAGKDLVRSSSCHIYALRINGITEAERDEMIRLISLKNIAVNVHFIPLPMLTLFKQAGFDIAGFPVSYDLYAREISLPVYPQLCPEQIDFIVENVVAAYRAIA